MSWADDVSWMRLAACADADPDLWFPDQGSPGAAAKRICATCPVLELCLDYAIHMPVGPDGGGIWAGLSAKELSRLRVKAGVKRHPTRGREAAA